MLLKMNKLLFIILLFVGCSKPTPEYMRSTEQRYVCHLRYHKGEYISKEYKLSIVAAYNLHITKHPMDYWGRCKEG